MLNLKLRQILQFNNLPLYANPISQSETFEIKSSVIEYSGSHGGYLPERVGGSLFKTHNIEIEAFMPLDDIPKKDYPDYIEWAVSELTKGSGKLWAVNEYGALMYCNAIMQTKSWKWEATRNYDIRLIATFTNLDGVWTVADPKKVFVADRECACKMYACNTCKREANCNASEVKPTCENCTNGCGTIPCCNFAFGQIALCRWIGNLFKRCKKPPRFFYSCSESERIFGNEGRFGNRFLSPGTETIIVKTVCIDTPICSSQGSITLDGDFTDPEIIIGNYKMKITGSYQGFITFNLSTNQVFYEPWATPYTKTEITSLITVDTTIPFAMFCKGDTTVVINGKSPSTNAYIHINIDKLTI